ncbi:hypothetical protein BAUCODRAFT_384618 [Baudoinia panamericana UAMH 10762]|uniref:Uncharacterized protein n=1 Tax=Baudoinia panamericana (strain UAMH 10762) TaxID=717646 RepID=M2LW68_BAUPA|nr:uncharacterized protein BAUCODRAFT_384618 [Baudoinia panamericana UAMH 10762]EMC98912.1 hypothetical protein BAUCODRAFT_384618 [Baudoinia panamericana UAMH 10762]
MAVCPDVNFAACVSKHGLFLSRLYFASSIRIRIRIVPRLPGAIQTFIEKLADMELDQIVLERVVTANATLTAYKTFDRHYDKEAITFTIVAAITVYNVSEPILLILTTFKRFRGLYFCVYGARNVRCLLLRPRQHDQLL